MLAKPSAKAHDNKTIGAYAAESEKFKAKNDSFAVILSEAKNLLCVSQVLRLRLRMTLKCHFTFYTSFSIGPELMRICPINDIIQLNWPTAIDADTAGYRQSTPFPYHQLLRYAQSR